MQQQLQQQQLDGHEADAAGDDIVAPDELPTFLQRSEIEVAEDALEEEADRRAFAQRRQRSQSNDELYDALHEDAGGQPESETRDGVYAVLSAGEEPSMIAGTSSDYAVHIADAGRAGATAASTAVSAAPTPAFLPLPELPDLESEHFSLTATRAASRLATPVRAGASTPLQSRARGHTRGRGASQGDEHEAQWIIDLGRDSNPQQYAHGDGGTARTVTIGSTRMRVALVGSAIRLWCFDDETNDDGEVVALAPMPKTPSERDYIGDDSIDSAALPGSASVLRRRASSRRSGSRTDEDDDVASLSSQGRSATAAEAAAADQVVSSDRIKRMKEAYFFPFGSVVFFNFSLRSELQILHWLSCANHLIQKWPAPINAWEVDSAEIGTVLDDEAVVQLVTSDMWERLTIAHTWARSVKVQVFEERVDACITQTKHLPRTMAAGLRPTLSSADLNRIIGYLLLEKRALNLDLDVGTLDTPDFIFFEAPALEQLYWQHADLLELRKRANVLNQRLDILRDLTRLIKGEMEFDSLKRLELVVCALVLFQLIVFLLWEMLLKDILHLVSGEDVSL